VTKGPSDPLYSFIISTSAFLGYRLQSYFFVGEKRFVP
jgi:hypothetical protein